MLGMGVITILHASTFKAGSGAPDKPMQWAKNGFLPIHGHMRGVIINHTLNEIMSDLQKVMTGQHKQRVARAIGRMIGHPFMFFDQQAMVHLATYMVAGSFGIHSYWIVDRLILMFENKRVTMTVFDKCAGFE